MRSTPVSRKLAESPLNGQQWRNRRALLPTFSIQSSMSVSFVNSKLLRLVLVEDSATKTEQRFVFAAGFVQFECAHFRRGASRIAGSLKIVRGHPAA